MTIHLKPELEALIKADVQRGPFLSVDEFVEQAVQMLHEQEKWFAGNRAEITAKIEKGYASAERGGLLTPEQVRAHLADASRLGAIRTIGDERIPVHAGVHRARQFTCCGPG
jgi:putative addiction module CopG family antidote